MRFPGSLSRSLPSLAGLSLAAVLSGCSVIGMLPGGYLLFPGEYYFVYDIQLDQDLAGGLCREEPACYEDSGVVLSWSLDQRGTGLEVRNETESPLRILWSEASIQEESTAEPLVAAVSYPHKGVEQQLYLPGLPQAPSVLVPGAVTGFNVFPRSRAEWRDFSGPDDRGFWGAGAPLWGLEPAEGKTAEQRRRPAERTVGRRVRVSVPIETGGTRMNLDFDLRVRDAGVRRVRW